MLVIGLTSNHKYFTISVRLPKPNRSWFQFSVRTLFSLPIVFAAAWWWITWPSRTAHDFAQLALSGRLEQVDGRFGVDLAALVDENGPFTEEYFAPRSSDIVSGRQKFSISRMLNPGLVEAMNFTATNGKVIGPEPVLGLRR